MLSSENAGQVVSRQTLAADILSGYLSYNQIEAQRLPALVAGVIKALDTSVEPSAMPAALIPAVSPRKSVFEDYIVSLEDGKKLTTLTKHLKVLGMTPDQYRAKWGLPKEYPMVAPGYAAKRSAIARKLGLGRRKTMVPDPAIEPAASEIPPVTKIPPVRRGRKPKAL